MGLWKIALVVLVGAACTEKGRQTMKEITKRLIEAGQSAAEKSSSTFEELKIQTAKLIEEVKSEKKDGIESDTKN